MRAYLCVRVRETINTVVSAYLMLLATISNTGTASSSSSNRLMRPLRTYMRYHCIDCMAAVASPASGHVPPPLAFEKFFFHYTLKQVVWFGLVLCQTLIQHYFFQPYSLWSDTITGYNGACAKANVVLPRDAMRYSAVFAVVRCPSVRLSIMFVHCIQTAEDISFSAP